MNKSPLILNEAEIEVKNKAEKVLWPSKYFSDWR